MSEKIYKTKDGAICAEFGSGMLGVGGLEFTGATGIAIWHLDEKVEINADLLEADGETTTAIDEKIRIIFTDPKSFDVVISQLENAKKCLVRKRESILDVKSYA